MRRLDRDVMEKEVSRLSLDKNGLGEAVLKRSFYE
jgi:hypothetical protein